MVYVSDIGMKIPNIPPSLPGIVDLPSKTKIMPFNFTKKYDFHPVFTIEDEQIDVVYETQ